jgi:hypothetical protein
VQVLSLGLQNPGVEPHGKDVLLSSQGCEPINARSPFSTFVCDLIYSSAELHDHAQVLHR